MIKGLLARQRRSYLAEVLADSPTGLWMLDDASGTTATDSSGNARHGTYAAGFTLAQSGPGGSVPSAVALIGEASGTGMVEFPSSATGPLTGDFTIEVLVRMDSTSDGWNLLSLVSAPSAYAQPMQISCGSSTPSNRLSLRIGTTGSSESTVIAASSSTDFTAAAWHHLGLTCSGTLYTLYIDGAAVTSVSSGAGRSLSGQPLRLGRRGPSDGQRGRTGRYAGLAVVPSALSADRLLAHSQAGRS